ncbi:hypothetical protein DD630_21850 [Streptomyces sp. BSE7F]|nr:hypothetical protein DD630_21850 [Streptomyces sp. BSE7F]
MFHGAADTARAVRRGWPLSGRPRPHRRRGLRRHAPARLTEGVTPADLAAAEIYPTIVRERGEPLDVVTAHYGTLVPYFRAAACDGDGVLLRNSCSGAGRRRGGVGRAGYGSAWTCGPTAFDQALPAVASQLVDQVIAPRRSG